MKLWKIAVAVLIFLLLAGCGGAGEVESFDADFGKAENITDFGGYKFVLASDYKKDSTTVLLYDVGTLFADAALTRFKDIEEAHNCEIVPCNIDFYSNMTAYTATGSYICEAAFGGSWNLQSYALIKGGLVLPMSAVEDSIDYLNEEKWGNRYARESLLWNNELYGLIPMLWPQYFYSACDYIFVVNEDIVSRLGTGDPREYVENGEWTREKLTEIVKAYDHTSASGGHVNGLTVFVPHFIEMALHSNNFVYAVQNGSSWESGMNTATAEESLTWASNFIFTDCKDYIKTDNTYPCIEFFIDGNATMILTHTSRALSPMNSTESRSIAFNVENFGILPFPTGPNAEYGEWVSVYSNNLSTVVLPLTAKEPDAAAFVIDKIFEPFDEYKTEADRLDYYLKNTFHDERDANVLYKMLENCRYNYYYNGARSIIDTIGNGGGQLSITQVLEENEDSYTSIMLECIVPVYESMEAVWGDRE